MSTTETYNIPMQQMRGTYEKLRTENPILLAGQICIEKDTNRFKVGDGSTPWNGLKYANASVVEMARVPAATDDTFPVGQVWKNTSGTKKFYILDSVAPGAAAWKQVLTSDDLAVINADLSALADRMTEAEQEIARTEEIAKGAARAKVFATVAAMEAWLEDSENTDTLKVGDNLYIIDREVPDYWWDGEQAQELETQKVSLVDYPKTTEVQALIALHAENTTAHVTAEERTAWNAKADADNARLTGVPEAPTAAAGTNTDQLATTAFVFNTLTELVIDGGDLG